MNKVGTVLIPLTLVLAGCGSIEGKFPSLAKRPFETEAAPIEPVATARETAKQLPDSLAVQVNAIERKFNAGRADYAALLGSAQATANNAAGSAVGSEAWVNAQLIVSRLDKSRAEAVLAQAEIDTLLSAVLDAESNNQDALVSPLIQPLQRRIAEEVNGQNEELDRLARRIGL
jgi:hypothetical protein